MEATLPPLTIDQPDNTFDGSHDSSRIPSHRGGFCSLDSSRLPTTRLVAASLKIRGSGDIPSVCPSSKPPPSTGNALTAREKRDLQKAQLRPLANRRPELYEEDEYSSDEYEQMMEMYNGTLASIEEGEIVKSRVLEIRDNMVVLDIGFKSEGHDPARRVQGSPDLKPGDEVEVLLEHLEDQEGSVVLSKKKADFMRVWERIRVAYENDQPVEGTLVKKIKGGVVVDLMGVDAFLPGSQIALRRVPNIDELLGQKFEFKIIKLNKRRRNIVVSRRVILEKRAGGQAREADEGARRRIRSARASSRTSPTSVRSSISAASTACSTSPTCRGAASRIRREMVQIGAGARGQGPRHRLGARAHLARPQAAPDAIRGRTSPRSIRSARASRARSSRSRTTARSSSSSRASKASCTSAR